MPVTRRDLLAAGAVGGLALAGCGAPDDEPPPDAELLAPSLAAALALADAYERAGGRIGRELGARERGHAERLRGAGAREHYFRVLRRDQIQDRVWRQHAILSSLGRGRRQGRRRGHERGRKGEHCREQTGRHRRPKAHELHEQPSCNWIDSGLGSWQSQGSS